MYRLILFTIVIVLVVSCHKKQDDPAKPAEGYVFTTGTGLTGKWLATERRNTSPGDPMWSPLPDTARFILEFKADSSFTSTTNFIYHDSMHNRYREDGLFIDMSSTITTANNRWFHVFDSTGRMTLAIQFCPEPCGYGMRRIR